VQAILAACIDRLPHDDKRLLQAAAAIGKEVPFALLDDPLLGGHVLERSERAIPLGPQRPASNS